MAVPKVFISYCWSNPNHEEWVLTLAKELRENGVDAILDKWDLKEGHDAIAFMEKMVTDPNINKVLIISDKLYAEKADGRSGGVGTETQIISSEIYQKRAQDKFVIAVTEKDDDGKPYLPTYYKSRIYVDFSADLKYIEGFEQLLRWIFDKPLHEKPAIGKQPSFLTDTNSISLGTTIPFKRAIKGLKESQAYASGAIEEYLTALAQNLEKFRITPDTEKYYDDLIVENINDFLPYRNEFIEICDAALLYSQSDDDTLNRFHCFFEAIIPYMDRPKHITSYQDHYWDNFKFIIHEIFLYFVAISIKREKFNLVNNFLSKEFYVLDDDRDPMRCYELFRNHLTTLDSRNRRLGLRRLSLHSDLLKNRAEHSGLDFNYLMQADFVLWIRYEIHKTNDWHRWWPETLLYAEYFRRPFEIFARAKSKRYFENIRLVLDIDDKEELGVFITELFNGKRIIPRWEHCSFNPSTLCAYEVLATIN